MDTNWIEVPITTDKRQRLKLANHDGPQRILADQKSVEARCGSAQWVPGLHAHQITVRIGASEHPLTTLYLEPLSADERQKLGIRSRRRASDSTTASQATP